MSAGERVSTEERRLRALLAEVYTPEGVEIALRSRLRLGGEPREGDPEPEGVQRVRDCDGDEWRKGCDGWWSRYGEPGAALWGVVMDYGPLTELL